MTGEPIDAATALDWGLVNLVVPHTQVLTKALEVASTITANAPLAVRASKAVVHDAAHLPEPEAWALMNTHYEEVTSSEDALEGPRAFAEKRPPIWTGR